MDTLMITGSAAIRYAGRHGLSLQLAGRHVTAAEARAVVIDTPAALETAAVPQLAAGELLRRALSRPWRPGMDLRTVMRRGHQAHAAARAIMAAPSPTRRRTLAKRYLDECAAIIGRGSSDAWDITNLLRAAPAVAAFGHGYKVHSFPGQCRNAVLEACFFFRNTPFMHVTDLTTGYVRRGRPSLTTGDIAAWKRLSGLAIGAEAADTP